MRIELTRKEIGTPYTKGTRTERGTFGKLRVYVNDELITFKHPQSGKTRDFLYTMENEIEGSESGKDLRIPSSDNYSLVWSSTGKGFIPPKYKGKGADGRNKTILVCDKKNPAFAARRILIHIGNSAIDTAGCILLGWDRNNAIITESTIAVELFYDLMEKHDIKAFSFHIKNEVENG